MVRSQENLTSAAGAREGFCGPDHPGGTQL